MLGGPSNREKSDEWEKANAAVLEGRKEGGSRELQTVSHTFQSLERLWGKSSWKSFPHTQGIREWFGTDSIYLPRIDYALPTWFSSIDEMIDSEDTGAAPDIGFMKSFYTVPLQPNWSDVDCRNGQKGGLQFGWIFEFKGSEEQYKVQLAARSQNSSVPLQS